MSPPQADKAGLHILLKLAALVIILAGIHAAADIWCSCCWRCFRYCSQPAGHGSFAEGAASVRHYPVVTAMLVMLTALLGVLAASLNDFVAMLPDFNRALTRKILQLRSISLP